MRSFFSCFAAALDVGTLFTVASGFECFLRFELELDPLDEYARFFDPFDCDLSAGIVVAARAFASNLLRTTGWLTQLH